MNNKIKQIVISVLILLTTWSFAHAQETYITEAGYFASTSEKMFDKAVDLIVAKDQKALAKMIDNKFVFVLKPGIRVHLVKSKMFSGKVKIRPVGEIIELWTFYEAVR